MRKIFSLKALFVINAVLAMIGGLGELLIPQQFVGSFVPSLDAGGEFIARNAGAFQLGTAVISFSARNVQDRAVLKAILAGFLVIHSGITLVAVQHGISRGSIGAEGVVDTVVHGLLAVGFGYFLLQEAKRLKGPKSSSGVASIGATSRHWVGDDDRHA